MSDSLPPCQAPLPMGILQARILEWVAMISYIAGRFFTISATWEATKYGQFSVQFSSVQVSRSVVSDSLQPHESQHARPPCPSPVPGVYSNSCALSWWCHPAISSSVIPFSSCPQSLPSSGSFPMSQLFAWGGQSTWVSASESVRSMVLGLKVSKEYKAMSKRPGLHHTIYVSAITILWQQSLNNMTIE